MSSPAAQQFHLLAKSKLLNVFRHETKIANEKKKRSLDERDKYNKEILSIMKTIDSQG
jgi:hypothetical protein